LEIDDVQFMKPLPIGKNISPVKTKSSLNAPIWSIGMQQPINFTGDQKFYFFDRNVGIGDSISIHFNMNADKLANATPIARMPKTGNSGWSIQTTTSGAIILRIGSIESHEEFLVEKMYEVGQPVSLGFVKQSKDIFIYKNGKLVGKFQLRDHETKDATAAGRLGTVGKEFEAVGEVVMQVNTADKETTKMSNFRGDIHQLRIYNQAVHQ
jgi:hypothetical protein